MLAPAPSPQPLDKQSGHHNDLPAAFLSGTVRSEHKQCRNMDNPQPLMLQVACQGILTA